MCSRRQWPGWELSVPQERPAASQSLPRRARRRAEGMPYTGSHPIIGVLFWDK